MGYVAAIASLVSAGIGAASSAGVFGGGAKKPHIGYNDLSFLNLPDNQVGIDQYLNQQRDLPALQNMIGQINTLNNQGWQDQLMKLDPNILKSVTQMGKNTLSELQGQVPSDVQSQISTDTAQTALQGGYAGTGMARNLTARDLGLNSLNMMSTGSSGMGNLLGALGILNPSNVSLASLLTSPQALLQRQDQQTQYNTDLLNQRAFFNAGAQASPSSSGNTGSAIAGGINNLLNNKNFTSNFSSLFGGGGGGSNFSAPAAGSSGVSGLSGPDSSFTGADLVSLAYG